jgi:lactate permease
MLLFICVIVLAQAYLFTWIIPRYQMLSPQAAASVPDFAKGYTYLLILAVVLIAFGAVILLMAKRNNYKPKADLSIVK